MEYLEGETLEQRLKKGALPLDQALQLGIQIADALAAAHRAGIVHRDLKPGNIMLTKSGAKLLDFGLAKTGAPALAGHLSMMPTTPPNLTAPGAILGTFQYMAPEQLEGQDADTRTDIFAFGAVVYEMVTGKKAFEGKSQASLIAAILEHEPTSLSTLQPLAPRVADAIVRKCLAKKPDDRWQAASDLGSALRWAVDAGGSRATSAARVTVGTPSTRTRRMLRGAVVTAVAFGLLVAGVVLGRSSILVDPARPVVFEVLPPEGVRLSPAPVASIAQLALAPDGRSLAYVAVARRGVSQLWVRSLDSPDAVAVPGTESAAFPSWSRDSRSLAFHSGGWLKKVDIAGGAPQPICEVGNLRGTAWSATGEVLFGPANGPLQVCPSGGGRPRVVTSLPPGAIGHQWPQFLPDGRHFLLYQRAATPELQGVYVASMDAPEITKVLPVGGMAVYDSAHLLFVRDGFLLAQPFDVDTLKPNGDPTRVADHVGYFPANFGYASVTASGQGVLAYGPGVPVTTTLQWRSRAGTALGAPVATGIYRSPRLSLDGRSALVVATDSALGAQPDIWTVDVSRGVLTRLTSDLSIDWFPAWWPMGSDITFGSARRGFTTPFRRSATGSEQQIVQTAVTGGIATYPSDVSSDGKFLLYMQSTSNAYDLGTLALTGEAVMTPFRSTRFNEVQGRFSPDGRWIAYASDESGRFEVYVRPFSVANDQTRVSVGGGMQPEWRRDGEELFFISADGRLMAVPLKTTGPGLDAGTPRALFDVEIPEPDAPFPTDYAVTPDGQRFLVNELVDEASRPALTVMLRWIDHLRK
jgi:Tol biopolymer transport system component